MSAKQKRAVRNNLGVGASLRRAMALAEVALLLPFAAAATQVEGGGTASTDCWVTFDSVPSANSGHSVRCADQNTACGDADTRIGYCGYEVDLILNSGEFMPKCMPADLSTNQLLIPYTEPANDDHPKHIDALQVFQTFIDSTLPTVTADMENIDSGFQPVAVPLSIGFTPKGPVFRATTLTIHTTMCTVPIHGESFCPTPPRDVDSFRLTCTPPIDPMTGKPMSACIGADGNPLSGTFQQIEEHIFDRKCSNLAACHNPGLANLCLNSSGCGSRFPYTDLVGQTPTNPAAQADGLFRVDPGNAANSLIVHKVNGGTQLTDKAGIKGAYGLRMPYNNTATGKTRLKLSRGEIQLITDWVAAGAPMTGFVPTAAPGACH
jgi:hypothetical protein